MIVYYISFMYFCLILFIENRKKIFFSIIKEEIKSKYVNKLKKLKERRVLIGK